MFTHIDYLLAGASAAFGALVANSIPRRTPRPASPFSSDTGNFRVVLKNSGPNKIKTIKALRELVPFSLREAKDLADQAGDRTVLADNLSKDEAVAMARRLQGIATVEIMESLGWRTFTPAL